MTMIQLVRQTTRETDVRHPAKRAHSATHIGGETHPHALMLAPVHRMTEAGSVTIATVQARGTPNHREE